MNYELAKQLKEAGFPQTGEFFYTENESICNSKDVGVHKPTLSELIEACGDKIICLERGLKSGWFAFPTRRDAKPNGNGDTPEEAVAKLWLELNKK